MKFMQANCKSEKALKTQVLKEKTQIIKRKGLSPKKGNEVPPTKIMKKETVSIQRRLGERIQLQTTTNGDNGPRRVIKSKRYKCIIDITSMRHWKCYIYL